MVRDGLHDFMLVEDEAVRAAQLLLLTHAHTMAEGAGAAGLAGGSRPRCPAWPVGGSGVVVTGGNASPDELRAVLATRTRRRATGVTRAVTPLVRHKVRDAHLVPHEWRGVLVGCHGG